MAFYIVNLGLQFFSRKIFLNILGTEILGLNSTAMNLLQFLNLAELGISSAVGFTLYKPLHEKDHTTICEIVTLQGHLYKRIAWMIIGGAAILMCFFPLIFAKIEVPLWYAYASFGVLLLSALLGYFVNYKQIVLTANQQDYKVLYSYRSVMLIKVAVQMAAVYYLPNPYVWWLVFEGLFAIIGSWSLELMTRKTFPFLRTIDKSFKTLRKQYTDFTTKIKQLFIHKIGRFVLTQTSPLIIYAFSDLTLVAYYGNYMIISNGVYALVWAIFNSMAAGIGNLVAEGNQSKTLSVFYELFNLRFIVNATICFTVLAVTPSFISYWIGKEYNLPFSTLILIIVNLYISLSRLTVDEFTDAYGLFHDIYAPIVESVMNIGLSVLLGYFWGLNGILLGVIISQITIILGWKPFFLFKHHFNGSFLGYHINYLKLLIGGSISALVCTKLILPTFHSNHLSITYIILYSSISGLSFAIILTVTLTLLRCNVDKLVNRFLKSR